jgi:hypothetical protein
MNAGFTRLKLPITAGLFVTLSGLGSAEGSGGVTGAESPRFGGSGSPQGWSAGGLAPSSSFTVLYLVTNTILDILEGAGNGIAQRYGEQGCGTGAAPVFV